MRVEPEIPRDLVEDRIVNSSLGEERVVGLPEARVSLLRACLHGELRRGHRFLVERQWVVLEHHAKVVAELRAQLRDRGSRPPAERALEVLEHHDRHQRVLRTQHRRLPYRHLVHGRVRHRCRAGPGRTWRRLGEVLLRPARVQLERADPRGDRLARFRLLSVERADELIDRLRAGELESVDEAVGRPARSRRLGDLLVRCHLACRVARADLGFHRRWVHTALLRGLLVHGRVQTSLLVEQLAQETVERTRAPQPVHRHRSFRRRCRLLVKRQGQVLPHDAQLAIAVLTAQVLQRPEQAAGKRALDVAEDHECHERIRATQRRVVGRNGKDRIIGAPRPNHDGPIRWLVHADRGESWLLGLGLARDDHRDRCRFGARCRGGR